MTSAQPESAPTTVVCPAVSLPDQTHQRLPIHFDELRRTWFWASVAAGLAGGVFGVAGAFFDLNVMLGILGGWSLAVTASGMVLYLCLAIFFATLFAGSFFVVSLVLLLPGLLLLSGFSRLRPVTAVAERWLLILTAAFCSGMAGIAAAGLWLPLKPEFLLGGVPAAAGAGLMVFRKVGPRSLRTAAKPVPARMQTHGHSVWEDLD
jgi:hypothetical protein